MRIGVVVLVASLAWPGVIHAQWSVTAQFGVHPDRLQPPQRVLNDNTTFMMSAPGEAPVIGLRLTRVLRQHFDIEAGIAVARNESWSGGGAVPLPEFSKHTTFTSAAVIWRPLDETKRAQLRMGAGPALIFHGGSGESVLTRQTDLGAVATAGASLRIGQRLSVGLDVQNYHFASRFGAAPFENGGYPEGYREGTRWRSEWLVLPSLRIAF